MGSLSVVVACGGLFNCGGVVGKPVDGDGEPERPLVDLGIARSGADEAGELTFPPQGRMRARPAIADEYRRQTDRELRIVEPALSDGSVVIAAKTLVIAFNQPIRGASSGAPAGGKLRIADETEAMVPGLATWQDDRTLKFEATRYLDPKKSYGLTLSDVESRSGRKLGAQKLTLRTQSGGVIGGKSIGHVPEPGKYRVVLLGADDGLVVSRRPQLSVMFDQPISLEAARKLVKLTDASGREVPSAIRHAASNNWRGVRVNPQFIAVATPLKALDRQSHYTLHGDDHASVDEAQTHSAKIEVADDLALTGIECGWWKRDDEICQISGDTVRTNRNEIHLRFNNQISIEGKALARHLAIAPAVRNLQVVNERWGGRIVMTGDFRPSVRYRVSATGLTDVFHQSLAPLSLQVEMQPLGASIAMPEGLLSLDEANTKRFEVTSRNVAQGKLLFWRVPEDDVTVFNKALGRALGDNPALTDPEKTLEFDVAAKQNELVTTQIDLSQAIDPSASWLVTVEAKKMAFSAEALKFPEGSAAAKAPVALLKPYGSDNLAVHAHSAPGITIVQVSRLGNGAPVKGANVAIGEAKGVSDDNGVAVLSGDTATSSDALVKVTHGGQKTLLPLARPVAVASDLFPDMARGHAVSGALRGFVVTDRGIYRPGADVGIKASAFSAAGTGLSPKKNEELALRLIGPTGDEVCRAEGKTGELGGIATQCALPADAKLGLHRVELHHQSEGVVAKTSVRVADFEPPKFKVDVEARATGKATVAAAIVAKYLFGAPMKGAHVQWSLTRKPASLPSGVHGEAGLSFRPEPSWFDDEEADKWSRTGEGALDDGGTLAVTQAIAFDDAVGPQRFTLEADVSDESYRHVANRQDVVVHPAPRYAGLRGPRGWVGLDDDVEVQLGVADQDGKAVLGAKVSAHLREVSWRYVDRRGPGGSITTEWRRSEREVGSCSVVSGDKPKSCKLGVPAGGDYRVVAKVDGREGGSSWFWAWGGGSDVSSATPTRGNVVQVLSDKPHYKPGDTARLIVRNPYPAATAIVTTQMGRVSTHQTKRLVGSAAMFEIPIVEAHAPHVHATVTLLPIGAKGREAASYRIGAARLPVTLSGSRLAVAVHSDRATYKPGEKVTVTMRVTDAGKPEGRAEIALAVVDEGVLRLTDFHAADPVPALRPPQALDFALRDSRAGLMALLEQSHVAGDGGGEEQGSMPHTRRRFVNTALWEPSVRTDEAGVAEVSFTLPDNLTEWRMMAVAVDSEGKGGNAEASFEVRKEIMLSAVMPRFAHVGDQLELAALLHNGSERDFVGTVVVDGKSQPVTVPAGARQRVAVPFAPAVTEQREVTMSVRDGDGVVVDALSQKLRVTQPGYSVHPTLAGVFANGRDIDVKIPDEAMVSAGATLELKLGEHLWPELGKRMEYLLDYPHGCVEQTTSSTLPLIAARDIFPRIGLDHHGDAWFAERIAHGIKRLASMRTSSGGLAYWPGDATPNDFGTAYAMRAVVRAKQGGIELPPGMLSGMQRYLTEVLLQVSVEPDLRATIAESLAMLDGLPPGIADALFDLRGDMSDFGRASLLGALAGMPEQKDRVRIMVAELSSHYDERGRAKDEHVHGYRYWGSQLRTDAQVAIALSRSAPKSLLARKIVENIAGVGGEYTTQTTAWGLLAVGDHLKALPPTGAPVAALLDGVALEPHRELPGGAREYRLPLAPLVGKRAKLTLSSGAGAFVGYTLRADYRLPLTASAADPQGELLAASGDEGPHLYRLMTTPEGDPVDPSNIKAGQVVRIALLADFPDSGEHSYLALTDRLPAGFAPVEQDLASTASAPGLHEQHPLSRLLRWNDNAVSHMELHDDSVQIYFDSIYGQRVAATYLARATTPGTFAQPPAVVELMYQPHSTSYTASEQVVIQ